MMTKREKALVFGLLTIAISVFLLACSSSARSPRKERCGGITLLAGREPLLDPLAKRVAEAFFGKPRSEKGHVY